MTSFFSTRVKNINKHTDNTHVIMLQEPSHQKGDEPQCQAQTKKGKNNTYSRQRSRERLVLPEGRRAVKARLFSRGGFTLGRYKTLSPTERARALSRLYFCAFFYRGAGKLTTLYHRSYKRRTVQASSSRRVQILCATLSCCLKESSRFCIYKRKNEGETKL